VSRENPVVHTRAAIVSKVSQVTIDEVAARTEFVGRSIDFLKVDVEGYEYEVLKGAERTLRRHMPLVVCEIEARHNPRFLKTFELLKELGYLVYVFQRVAYSEFDPSRLESVQQDVDLRDRLSRATRPKDFTYLNNFVFAKAGFMPQVKP
jgi:hypothetical protein